MKRSLFWGLVFLFPVIALGDEPAWVISKECWGDGVVEACGGRLVERRAKMNEGFPKYTEFWDEQRALVGLAVNLPQSVMQCDKLEGKFVCEFRPLPLKPQKKFKTGKHYESAEELAKATGLTVAEVGVLGLDWEVMRVVSQRGNEAPLRLTIPLKNTARDRRRATLKLASKEKGTATKLYAVPRLFNLNK